MVCASLFDATVSVGFQCARMPLVASRVTCAPCCSPPWSVAGNVRRGGEAGSWVFAW